MEKRTWSRAEVAAKVSEFEVTLERSSGSQRQLAEEIGLSRSTLQYWQKRQQAIDASPEAVAFFESPAGVVFLHRLILAAHFAMNLVGNEGIRLVCLFLELSLLDRFVGASYGPQQALSQAMEEEVIQFGQAEDQRLSQEMTPKEITLCQDETLHAQPCLVGIEPRSNFILLEQYAPGRSAKDWNEAMQPALQDKPIKIIQSTSDEGQGICRYVKEELGAHHSPDLMHVQAELVKATSTPLSAKTRQAQTALEQAQQQVQRHKEEKAAYHLQLPPPQGRPPDFDQRIQKAQEEEAKGKQTLEEAQTHQAQAKQAIQDISATYHPYDLERGAPQRAEDVAASLEEHFTCIEGVAHKANLSQRCWDKIHKAKKRTVDMVATIAFFFLMIQAKVEALELPPHVEEAVYEHLLPGIYLSLVAQKAPTAQERHRLEATSKRLLDPLLAEEGPLSELEEEDIELLEHVAQECAHLFQRSSSCVEGRNGYLALRHHHLHRITHRKLKALTTVHNYFIKRPDGTTPAERFFGAKPKDLFEWLVERLEIPGRPAQKRSQPKPKTYLIQAFG